MKIIFACAGTGGHINPAIAIANIVKKREKDVDILFIGTKDGLENKLVKNAGYEIKHISTGKIRREFTFKNVDALTKTLKGIKEAKKIMREFKPDLVIGTGGYICGAVMTAAKKYKIPYMLHESNAFPGVTVKLLAKNATSVMIGFEDARARLKNRDNIVYTGTPAKFSKEDIDKLDREKCLEKLSLKSGKKIILVTCGSQGAKRINNVVLDMVKKYQDDDRYIILVTGDKNYDEVTLKKEEIEKKINKDLNKYIKIEKFVYDMDVMYKAVDMCVTRAGAMTITELALASKPAILIPLPTAAENHQFFNAKVLESINAAKIIEQKDLNEDTLNESINTMLDENVLKEMATNARKVVIKDVDDKIYNCIINSLKK